jgi:DNA-binding NtrC family response regulator
MISLKKNKIVVLCSELASIRAITESAGRLFEIAWARDARTFVDQLAEEPSAAVVDNAAAHTAAIGLLQTVRQTHPKARRVLLTDYCDLAIIVQGLHTEAVQKIVYKPVHGPELLHALGAQLETMVPVSTPIHRSVGGRAVM